jgi:hypothetical protein
MLSDLTSSVIRGALGGSSSDAMIPQAPRRGVYSAVGRTGRQEKGSVEGR